MRAGRVGRQGRSLLKSVKHIYLSYILKYTSCRRLQAAAAASQEGGSEAGSEPPRRLRSTVSYCCSRKRIFFHQITCRRRTRVQPRWIRRTSTALARHPHPESPTVVMFRTATRTIKAGRPALKASLAPAAAAATASMKTAKLSHYDEVLEESPSEKNPPPVSTFNPAIHLPRIAPWCQRDSPLGRSAALILHLRAEQGARCSLPLATALARRDSAFALKANPHPLILETVVQSGASIDCASKAEMEAVMGICGTVNNVILSNPCKDVHHLAYARMSTGATDRGGQC